MELEGVNWIYLDENGENWRVLVHTFIKFPVPQNAAYFLTS
jgi:hypothetical protein